MQNILYLDNLPQHKENKNKNKNTKISPKWFKVRAHKFSFRIYWYIYYNVSIVYYISLSSEKTSKLKNPVWTFNAPEFGQGMLRKVW